MRSNILKVSAIVLIVTLVITVVAVFVLPKRQGNVAEPNDINYSNLEQLEEIVYTIKAHNGYVAVFAENNTEPEIVFDVKVRLLPLYDQGQLEQGVAVKGYSALTAVLEDYIS